MPRVFALPLLLLVLGCRPPLPLHAADSAPEVHTFSIVAFDPATGELGVAVESKYFGVGSVVPWAKAGVGAVATQARVKVSFGPEGLRLMEAGQSSREALDTLLAADPQRAERQVGMINAQGRTAAHTGTDCFAFAGHREGKNYTVQGNLLAGETVLTAMAEAYERAQKEEGTELADWLLAALTAGQAAGGDRRGQQSAALLVVRAGGGPGGDNDRYCDLRVEDHPTPIAELTRLRALHRDFYGAARLPRPER
jgi:uncharacterized Ntn-hydrolase superfamily protein